MEYEEFKNIVKYALIGCCILFALSWWNKSNLPPSANIVTELYDDPVQERTYAQPFEMKRGGKTYKIVPRRSYEITGLVVSYHDSKSWLDVAHSFWGDYLNEMDLCLVWGSNLKNELHDEFFYSNGDFTCFVKGDPSKWKLFDSSQFSNNHLIGKNKAMTQKMFKASVGDQVRVKGMLVDYYYPDGSSRKTSLSLFDMGNACENIYVKDFTILKKGNKIWWMLYNNLPYILGILLLLQGYIFYHDMFMYMHKDADYYYQLGVRYTYRGKHKKAVANFSKAIELDSDMVDAYRDRGHALQALGEEEKADFDFNTANSLEARHGYL